MFRVLIVFCAVSVVLSSQEWRYYGGDAGGMKYSPLKQIDRSNI
jgi:glucose dehydrogenase